MDEDRVVSSGDDDSFDYGESTDQTPESSGTIQMNSSGNSGYTFGNADDYIRWLQEQASQGNEAAIDKLGSFYLGEESNKIARDWTAAREDSAYQRMYADAKKAGINPMALMAMGGSPIASSSSGSSYSSQGFETARHNKETEEQKYDQMGIQLVLGILSAVALIAVAAL